jgi:hypothetical protein
MLIAAVIIVIGVVWYLAPMEGTEPTAAAPEASEPAASTPAAPAETTPETPATTTP